MKVLVTVAPQALWHGCMAQFALLTAKTAALLIDAEAQLLEQSQTPAQLATLLNRYPQAEFAVAYEASEVMLGRLLATGHTPEQAAQQWFEQTEALLQLQQQQRKRVKLFSLSAATHFAALPDWITLQAKAVPVVADTVYTLLAAQLLRQLPQYGALQQRLFASSLPLTEHTEYQVNLAAVLQQISDKTEVERLAQTYSQSQQQLQNANAQLSASNGERDLLLLQLQQVQEELEQYYLKWQSAEQKSSHADTARDKQQQRELAKLEGQLRKTKARAAGAEHQLQLLQQELDAVKGSTLWKSAAPVRVLKRLVTKTDNAKQKLQQEAALIITSEYFDIDWYLARYPDVAAGNINPAEHYLKFGANEGRIPGPLFDGDWYLQRYPDVATSGINPLLHFIKFGQLEGRSASPKLLADHSTREE